MSIYSLIRAHNHSSEMWDEVRSTMSVHTQNKSPRDLFEKRRPSESSNDIALQYRIDNYRNVVKSSFDKAIDSYIETAFGIDVKVQYDSEALKTFESTYKKTSGLKRCSLKEYVLSHVGRQRQTDPNAVLVCVPKHPTLEIIPSYREQIPLFTDADLTKAVRLDFVLVPSSDIKYLQSGHVVFLAGKWEYQEGKYLDYYLSVSQDSTHIIYPKMLGEEVVYEEFLFYINSLSVSPVIPIASNWVDDCGGYYIPEFYGAAMWADMMKGQLSDLNVCETRYTFPVLVRVADECTDMEATYCPTTRLHKYNDGSLCRTCGGKGHIEDITPMGTYIIKRRVGINETQEIKVPFQFVTPPSDILKHSADRVEYYMSQVMKELCLVDQNMTAQSGESKRYDLMQKVTMITNIVTDLYFIYRQCLEVAMNFLDISALPLVNVTFPDDFDIKNANDILFEITEAKKSNLPEITIKKLTKDFYLKKFGDSDINRKRLDFLSRIDKLFIYGTEDLKSAKMIFGEDLTARDITIHSFGMQVLEDLTIDILTSDFSTIKAAFDAELEKYITSTTTL